MILDYSQYITEKGTIGIVNSKRVDNNVALFKHDSVCPFCKKKIERKVYQKHRGDNAGWLSGTFDEWEYVVQCLECGWWEYKYFNQSDAIDDGIRASDIEYSSAILRSYNDNAADAPVNALREYIIKNPNKIYKINEHKMEDLVRSVFSDFYPSCKVKKFGQTRDGGKDGLLIDDGGRQFLISVKRRESPKATEGVSTLRDLMGAMIVENDISGCIVVSTANHFSRDAKSYAEKVLAKKIIEEFDLIDCKDFLRIVDLTKDKLPTAWERILRL